MLICLTISAAFSASLASFFLAFLSFRLSSLLISSDTMMPPPSPGPADTSSSSSLPLPLLPDSDRSPHLWKQAGLEVTCPLFAVGTAHRIATPSSAAHKLVIGSFPALHVRKSQRLILRLLSSRKKRSFVQQKWMPLHKLSIFALRAPVSKWT
jgi:hypothetical protein